jgi:hypothetical protein
VPSTAHANAMACQWHVAKKNTVGGELEAAPAANIEKAEVVDEIKGSPLQQMKTLFQTAGVRCPHCTENISFIDFEMAPKDLDFTPVCFQYQETVDQSGKCEHFR